MQKHSIDLASIHALILSHQHLDHVGNPNRLPTRNVIVGPGFLQAYGPDNPQSEVPKDALLGKSPIEIDFGKSPLRIGGFEAFDYFRDGSFYLLSTPGHTIGHMSALARVSVDGDGRSTFVLMGGDVCHHMGELRPSNVVPLPEKDKGFCSSLVRQIHPKGSDKEPFFQPTSGWTIDVDEAVQTISKLTTFDADPNIMVMVAHDITLMGLIDMFPDDVGRWKEKGWKQAARWGFLTDFEMPK